MIPSFLEKRLSIPVIASPMFIVSYPELVIEQCKAGIVGSFPSLNARTEGDFEQWIKRISSELEAHDASNPEQLSAPFAVNLIVHKSNPRIEQDLALCVKYKVPIVITSLGARTDVNEAIHSYGGVVWHDITNNYFAKKAVSKGADGLIAVAAGAGGHAGEQSPLALIREIREWFDGTLLLSGSIACGNSVLAARAMGADLGYIGSAFIASTEANAALGYKQMIVDCNADDIVYSNLFTGIHGNYLKPSIAAAGLDPNDLPVSDPSKMNFGGDLSKAWKDIWGCGQGIGAVKSIESVADIVARLKREYEIAKQRLLTANL